MHRPYFTMGRRKRKKASRGKRAFILALITLSLVAWLMFYVVDGTIIPAVTTIASQRAVTVINEVINETLTGIIDDFVLTSEDFYSLTTDDAGRLTSLSVDTILVNRVANLLAMEVSSGLSYGDTMRVGVPMGLFTGMPIFAGAGPDFYVSVVPAGEATVEYETSFTSAGINQINFQVWLYVETTMRIVLPLQDATIPVSRRVPLVNTVFAGEVPEGMLLTNFGMN